MTKWKSIRRRNSGSCSVFLISFDGALSARRSRREGGYSLVEAIAALTIFGIAILVAAGFLDVQMSASRRLEARTDLLRAAETVLESVRGGILPLETAVVDLGDEFQPFSAITVKTTVEVAERSDLRGLYQVRVVASAMVRTENLAVSITTQVWRP